MANITNPWLTAYQRSFNQIKTSILGNLSRRMPEITDYTEGNIFILIISIFSGIAEVLHYYIDNIARETFFPTALRYSSLVKHATLVDYPMKLAIPSTCDLTLYLSTGEAMNTNITIPSDTIFTSTDGKTWISTREVTFVSGTYSCLVPVKQWESNGVTSLGTYVEDNVIYLSNNSTDNKKIANDSVVLQVNNELWTRVESFATYGPNDKVFKVGVSNDRTPYLIFGDGQFGKKPNNGSILNYSCYLTYGSEGNIDENSFSEVPATISSLQDNLAVTNIEPASGGSDYETFDMLKDHIPLSVRTLGVAITKEDYEAIAKLMPGVNKAYVEYDCIRWVTIYITPDGGGIATQSLIDEVSRRFDNAKVVTTSVDIYSTQECLIYLQAEITGKKSYNSTDISTQVKQTLVQAYSYDTSDVNKVVRISDLYALIDNCTMVDYANITGLYLLSTPRIDNSSDDSNPALRSLNITNYVLNTFNISLFYTLNSSGEYEPASPGLLVEGYDPYYQLRFIAITSEDTNQGTLSLVIPDSTSGVSLGMGWTSTNKGNYKLSIFQGDTEMIGSAYSTINLNTAYKIKLISGSEENPIVAFDIDITISQYSANGTMLRYENNSIYTLNIQADYLSMLQINKSMDLTPLDYNMPLFNSNTITLNIHEVV